MASQDFVKIKININLLESLLDNYFQVLLVEPFQVRNYLKYSPTNIVTQCSQLLKEMIKYIMMIKFSALIEAQDEQLYLVQKDYRIKSVYQLLLQKGKLNTETSFQFFIIIVIKIIAEFFDENFKDFEITEQDHCEIYCLIIKLIIGLNVTEKGYSLLNTKYTDPEKYQILKLLQANKKKTVHKISMQKSVNLIELKLQKRKLKRSENSVILNNRSQHKIVKNSLQDFKENLKTQLKVTKYQSWKQHKKKRRVPDKQNDKGNGNGYNLKQQYSNLISKMSKNVIYTQQISSSMVLSKLLKNEKYSYTKRNVRVRYTDSSCLRLSGNQYQVSVHKKQMLNHSIQKQKPLQNSHVVQAKPMMKKTARHWDGIKKTIQTLNKSFQY